MIKLALDTYGLSAHGPCWWLIWIWTLTWRKFGTSNVPRSY